MWCALGLEAIAPRDAGSVVTIGKFFAVHRGHQALLRATVERARVEQVEAVVVTFDRHPQEVLRPGTRLPLLASLEERLAMFEALGLDGAVVIHTTREFLALTPEAFVRQVLVERLRARAVIAGEEFRFGRGAVGTLATLRKLGITHGFDVAREPPVLDAGERISSSRVAARLAAGDVATAARLLGRPYSVAGTVVEGRRLGRTLGFPTANLALDSERLLPADGVYLAELAWDGEARAGVANLGVRPTVDGTARVLEIHLFDFAGDLYGETAALRFRERLRDEQRFASIEELRAQIERDAARGRALLAGDQSA